MSIEWINPAALLGLAAVAGPVLVHLLRRRRASRLAFPSLRFLTTSRAAAMRMNSPADVRLLVLRAGIVAAAAAALAQPVLVTDARRASRHRAIARAIVIDTSPGMAHAASQASEAAAAERNDAISTTEVAAEDLRAGLRTAVTRLAAGPTARREIVVISAMRHDALTADDIAWIPPDIGVRFIRVGAADVSLQAPRTAESRSRQSGEGDATVPDVQHSFGAPGVAAFVQTVTLTGPRTALTLTRVADTSRSPRIISAADEQLSVQSLLRSVAAAGAPAPPANRLVTVAFPRGPLPAAASEPREPWMLRAIVSMRADRVLRDAAETSNAFTSTEGAPWVTVARNAQGSPVVTAAAVDGALVSRVNAGPETFVAAAAVRALLFAIAEPPDWNTYEVERIPDSTLQAWTRPAAPVPDGRSREAPPGDARWCWALVLLLLGLESVVRKGHRDAAAEENARAA